MSVDLLLKSHLKTLELPTILQDRGLTAVTAGLALSVSILLQVSTAILAPWIGSRMRDQRTVLAVVMTPTTGASASERDSTWRRMPASDALSSAPPMATSGPAFGIFALMFITRGPPIRGYRDFQLSGRFISKRLSERWKPQRRDRTRRC